MCPFINTTIDEKPIQLSQFNTEDDLVCSFTRAVTKKYMISLSKIKQIVQTGRHDAVKELKDNETISGNFIESILELGEYGDNEEVEIITSWSPVVKEVIDVPNTVSFTKDYIAPLEFIASK